MSAAARSVFVTGTDTGVGKTRIACALLDLFRANGLRAAGFKPVAAGAVATSAGLRNDDALALLAASAPGLRYADVNPYCYATPIAPHLAAQAAGERIELARLDAAYERLIQCHDRVVIEGAGGWLVPLDAERSLGDWAGAHRWPVILVVGIRLGCINHALLTAEAVVARTALLGWVANLLPPAATAADDIIQSLRTRLPAPLLATVAAHADVAQIAAQFAACPRSGIWA